VNPRLTPTQIEEIFAAAEHVDVPVEQLLDAAAEIRAALLGASDDVVVDLTQPSADAVAPPRVGVIRRARAVRTTLVAAALALALVISTAVSGALPDPIQGPVSRVTQLFGLDLPVGDPAHAGAVPNGTSQATAGDGTKVGPLATDPAGAPSGIGPSSTARASVTRATDGTVETTPTTKPHGPPEVPGAPNGNAPAAVPDASNGGGSPESPGNGTGNGPPEVPGTPNGNGPPENPGNGNGNGPPEVPGTPNGNGPPENPGNGNGNGPPEIVGGSQGNGPPKTPKLGG
jgi:hypothetical protein